MPISSYRWTILILSYLCMLGFVFALQSLPPILPLFIQELRITRTEAGLLMGLFALPAIFLSIPAGLLSDVWGPFKTGILSLLLVVIGTLFFAFSTTLLCAGLGRVISGSGAVTISIVSAQILSQWFREHEIGTAMGIYNTAMPAGTIVCFTTFGRLGVNYGWRTPIFIPAMTAIAGLTAFAFLYKPAPEGLQNAGREKEKRGFFPDLGKLGAAIWLLGFCWMWFNAATISFLTFAPDFFVSKGYTIGFAGFLTSVLMWGSLGLSPLIGRLVDRVDNNELFIAVSGIMLAATIYLVTRSTKFVLPMVLMALAVAFVPTPVYSLLPKILEPQSLGLGFGILSTLSSIGMFMGPYIAGLIKDKTGWYETSFIFLCILAILMTLTAIVLRIRMKKGMA